MCATWKCVVSAGDPHLAANECNMLLAQRNLTVLLKDLYQAAATQAFCDEPQFGPDDVAINVAHNVRVVRGPVHIHLHRGLGAPDGV